MRIPRLAFALTITLSFVIPYLANIVSAEPAAEPRTSRSATKKRTPDKKSSHKDERARRGEKAPRSHRRRESHAPSRRESQPTEATANEVRSVAPGIPTERVSEIQRALIRLGYLDGPAGGQYDDATFEAMKQFQTDNQLSATGLPSAHALKRLGLPKRNNDGYTVPVKSVSQSDKL